MVPLSAWGTQYVVSRSKQRWSEKDYIRVLASQPGTQVTVNPAVTSPPVFTLGAGQFKEFTVDSDFTIVANQPVMVVQFLASSHEIVPNSGAGVCFSDADCVSPYTCHPLAFQCAPPTCNSDADCPQGHTCGSDPNSSTKYCQPIGDPAMILAVPIEQWRNNYVFLTPDSYAQDYVNIVSESGAIVTFDDKVLTPADFVAVPGANYQVHRTLVADGVHRVSADKPVAITVYGYDDDVSYGYPGGLGVDKLSK
jgi:hypothetical protein